ncbi:MAG: radical SAM protein [Thermodesulfobacteriota bacterium]
MARPPLILPFFISHAGCPHRCLFCDQQAITGQSAVAAAGLDGGAVAARLDAWLPAARAQGRPVQVAFFGGSFTGLPVLRQEDLLAGVGPRLADGSVAGIRISTRPDALDDATARRLAGRGVTVVELGVQSMDRQVLAAVRRGYSPEAVVQAFAVLRRHGLAVGGQLMIGLPAETPRRLLASGRWLADLAPDFVRLYPTLVLAGSGLARLLAAGRYRPLSLAEAIARSARLCTLFAERGIPVIRIGLQSSPALAASIEAGPYHPAFGELVQGRLLFRQLRRLLARSRPRRLCLSRADESQVRGPGNISLRRLASLGLLAGVELRFLAELPRGTITVDPPS